jgi:cytochrome c-type biogenesis protein CcmH
MSGRLSPARRASWAAILLVVVAALVVGVLDDSGRRTAAERARDIASTIRCPTCRSQSVADSEAASARALRIEIERRVTAGETDDEIRAYAASRFGEDVLLTPERSGLGGLVWVLPVAIGVAGAAFVVVVLRRWGAAPAEHASDADRDLVARARPGRTP